MQAHPVYDSSHNLADPELRSVGSLKNKLMIQPEHFCWYYLELHVSSLHRTLQTQSILYTLLSALDPGLTFVIACKPGTEATIPQYVFLPGVGVEGFAAPSPEDTLVLCSGSASSHGRIGQVETIVVIWDFVTLLTSAEQV